MNPDLWKLLEAQCGIALLVLLGLPFGLLLLASQPRWLAAAATAVEGRRTAGALWGAGVFVAAVLALAVCTKFRPLNAGAVVVIGAAVAVFAAGFAVSAWSQGRAMLGRDGGASCMVWGWTARAGLIAVPLIGWALGAYLVALSLGTPVLALFARRPNATTAPSPGSTQAS